MPNNYAFDPFANPDGAQLAAWVLALLTTSDVADALRADDSIVALSYAACATSVDPPKSALVDPAQVSRRDRGSADALRELREMAQDHGSYLSGRFATLFLTGQAFVRTTSAEQRARALSKWRVRAEEQATRITSPLSRNLAYLATILELNEAATKVLYFQLARRSPGFRHLFDTLLREASPGELAVLLGLPYGELTSALDEDATLVRSGIVEVRQRPWRIEPVSRYFEEAMHESAESADDFAARFVTPFESAPSTQSLARLDAHDAVTMTSLLTGGYEGGAHVLVHAPRTINAVELVGRTLNTLNSPVHVVNAEKVPAGDLAAWVFVAQRALVYLTRQLSWCTPVLVVPRAEVALTSRRSSLLSLFGLDLFDDDERASDVGLTGFPGRCVWITDRAQSLTEANLGRFIMHVEALPGSRGDRRERVTAVLAEADLDPAVSHQLSKYPLLSEQVVRQAIALADRVTQPGDAEHRRAVITRAVERSQRMLGRADVEDLRDSVTTYDLDLLNLASRFTPQQIVGALRQRRGGTLLFHGIPGAGKTQFAEYLAVELDMPLVIKRASDILSKWLGESEHNIADAFAEAEAEGAILFIDEADSFLRDRTLARAEWSVTQVNELLQHLERARGIVICATNLMGDIDSAALRRFTFKVEFLALRAEQAWRMFVTETGFDTAEDPARTEACRARLARISDLAPGDFATVKRMATLLDTEAMSPENWLDQLESEAKLKMHGLKRMTMGFSSR